jgi:hypothetical protein
MARRKAIPAALLKALPSAKLYESVKFAGPGAQTKAKAVVTTDWPAKVGS